MKTVEQTRQHIEAQRCQVVSFKFKKIPVVASCLKVHVSNRIFESKKMQLFRYFNEITRTKKRFYFCLDRLKSFIPKTAMNSQMPVIIMIFFIATGKLL
jgi:hypothetical protein